MQVLYKSTIIFAEIEKLNLKFTNYGQTNVKTDKVGKNVTIQLQNTLENYKDTEVLV